MAGFSDFVSFFHHYRRRIDKLVDTALENYTQGMSAFDRDCPIENYEDRELVALKADMTNNLPMLASVVAEEEELPNETPYYPLSAEAMGNLKLGLQHIFLARHYERLNMINRMDLNPRVREALIKSFMGMASDLVPSMIALATKLMIDILVNGQCLYRDPRTGAVVRLVYPTDNTLVLPALAGNLTWTPANAATANGIQDLIDHANAYYTATGMKPPKLYLRRQTLLNLAAQATFKRAFVWAQTGQIIDPTINLATVPTLEDTQIINAIRTLTGVQAVEIFEAKYTTRAPDGSPSEHYYLDENTYFFLKPNVCERAFVPTVERNFEPGFYVRARVMNDAPRRERVAGVCNYIPFVFDSKKIASRKVA